MVFSNLAHVEHCVKRRRFPDIRDLEVQKVRQKIHKLFEKFGGSPPVATGTKEQRSGAEFFELHFIGVNLQKIQKMG